MTTAVADRSPHVTASPDCAVPAHAAAKGRRPQQVEIDFLALEVKGGAVQCKDGVQIEHDRTAIVRLTENQLAVLESLVRNPRGASPRTDSERCCSASAARSPTTWRNAFMATASTTSTACATNSQ